MDVSIYACTALMEKERERNGDTVFPVRYELDFYTLIA
jgi:hypothetical protein